MMAESLSHSLQSLSLEDNQLSNFVNYIASEIIRSGWASPFGDLYVYISQNHIQEFYATKKLVLSVHFNIQNAPYDSEDDDDDIRESMRDLEATSIDRLERWAEDSGLTAEWSGLNRIVLDFKPIDRQYDTAPTEPTAQLARIHHHIECMQSVFR